MATLATPIRTLEKLNDPACVKVVFDGAGRALYFSRSPIPHRRALFDIGVAGPLAGFVVCLPVLWMGIREAVLRPLAAEPEGIFLGEPLSPASPGSAMSLSKASPPQAANAAPAASPSTIDGRKAFAMRAS